MKQIIEIKLYSLFLIITYFPFLFSCNFQYQKKEYGFIPSDTIILKSRSLKNVISYIDDKSNKSLITYVDIENECFNILNENGITNVYYYNEIIKNIKKAKLNHYFYFVGKNQIFYLLGKYSEGTSPELSRKNEYFLYEVNSNKFLLNSTPVINKTGKNINILTPNYQLPIISSKDSMVYICATAIQTAPGEKGNHDYHINTESRISMFSQESIMLLVIKKNGESYIYSENIRYPSYFLDTNLRIYQNFPSINIFNHTEIVTLYSDFDTLYSFDIQSKQIEKHFFTSKYKTPFKSFDLNELFNYEYIFKDACEHSNYLYLKTNSLSNELYIIVKKPVLYENEDGTVNSPKHNPFSIIILDQNYESKGEFSIPKEFSKHNSFPFKKGLAILNDNLTSSDPNHYLHYVVFEYKLIDK